MSNEEIIDKSFGETTNGSSKDIISNEIKYMLNLARKDERTQIKEALSKLKPSLLTDAWYLRGFNECLIEINKIIDGN